MMGNSEMIRKPSRNMIAQLTRWVLLVSVMVSLAQLSGAAVSRLGAEEPWIAAEIQTRLEVLREEIEARQYSYTVGYNPAMDYTLDQLCGLVEPPDWHERAIFKMPTARLALPASFDWKEAGGVTPVKNQGGCGSCWAFGTVGPLESLIKIKCGLTRDLSEQYLVSCNEDGWGCGGGWFAHDYHEWKVPTGESNAGAVWEKDFPYVALDVACNGPFSHPWQIDGWAYVGNWWSVPYVDDIKQAIMQYGPVAAAVYVGPAFQAYNGGVFDNNECPGCQVNHAIVLVGWDDNQGSNGVWILRNSWGTGWGENGYMRIEYGISSVGYAANYVEFSQSQCPNPPPSSNNSMPWLRLLLLEEE